MSSEKKLARLKLAVVITHPIQYYTPIFVELARLVELKVIYALGLDGPDSADIGFSESVRWDIDLMAGYNHEFLPAAQKVRSSIRLLDENSFFLNQFMRRFVPDAVLIFGWYRKPLLQALMAAKLNCIPTIVRGDSHLKTPRSGYVRALKALLTPAILRCFDAALYTGTWSREYFQKYGMASDQLFYSPHCIDNARFASGATSVARNRVRREIGADQKESVILMVARLIELKRPLDVVDAAARLKAFGNPTRVIFAGVGPLGDAIRSRADFLGVPVNLLGFVNQSELPGVYAAADVVVLASERETWGLTCNEALACGRPIVVSAAAGCAPDLVGCGTVGRIFAPGDVYGFAMALETVLSDPPSPSAIRAKSDAHSVRAAVQGIIEGLAFVTRKNARRRTVPSQPSLS